ncbi:hypothetical protein J7E83_15875 [Arthrobacter sp. ISL-48]|uniref:hypothetical protein n=1 Tax=Arthrobacter sp. ISL-48 TaxID=2819110 RepID=UPI001BEC2DC1|nr:hypothetical protein [Arthrobacter sp. ISL-48]MBT2533572.1 hypothetical protein [Arthrobacter sp. ISL-48]
MFRIADDSVAPDATVRVGAAELGELEECWKSFLATSSDGDFDPVTSLRCTGAVIRAVENVISTVEEEQST